MNSFNWKNLVNHAVLPNGNYIGDVVDQHEKGWCGCCYVVCAIQMIEDRFRIEFSKTFHKSPRLKHVDIQTIMDYFEEATEGWNVCHGGYPLSVLGCMQDRTCPIVWSNESDFLGYSRDELTKCSAPNPYAERIHILNPRRISEHEVEEQILEYGPVILEINGDTLKKYNARGIVSDLSPQEPNHAVTVVGWEEDNWIVRNSWGTKKVPTEIPSDLKCVARGKNDCSISWSNWSGKKDDPGYILLPKSFKPLHEIAISPWIVADVVL